MNFISLTDFSRRGHKSENKCDTWGKMLVSHLNNFGIISLLLYETPGTCVVMTSTKSLSGSGGIHSQHSPVLTGASTGAPCSWWCSCWDYSPRNWVAHLLRKGFLDHACFLSCLHPPSLCCVTAFAPPEPGSLLQPCQPCRWYCSSLERHICQPLLLSHRNFFPSGLRFCWEHFT